MRVVPVVPARGKGQRLAMVVGMLVLIPATSARVEAQRAEMRRIDYTASVGASRGRFVFSEATTSWVFDQGALIGTDRWSVGLHLPLVLQNSSAITYIGGIPLPTGGPDAGAMRGRTAGSTITMSGRRGSGAGTGSGAGMRAWRDPEALAIGLPSASLVDSGSVAAPGPYALHVGDPVLQLETGHTFGAHGTTRVGASVLAKLPLADPSTGVGTGRFDYGAGFSVSSATAHRFVYADVEHWVLGDMVDLPLRDLTSAAIGAGLTFGEMGRISTLVSLSGATALVDNADAPLAAGVSVGVAVREHRFVTLGATVGLSESSPDWSVTLGWRISRHAR